MSWRTLFLLVLAAICMHWGKTDADEIVATVYFVGAVICDAIDRQARRQR